MPKLTESTQNYLETILLLQNSAKVIRVKDISRKMNVSMPSVHTALHLLEDQKLINHEKYGHIELTPKGIIAAEEIYALHKALVQFLTEVLGVTGSIAENDACKIEHVISHETIKRMAAYMKKNRKTKEK